jgi:ATP-dependent Clp protease ATP-binding subunit ClpA
MFERFTHEAREIVVRAQEEAKHLAHDYIGTEHLLLGFLASSAAPLAQPLNLQQARLDVVRLVGRGHADLGLDAEALAALGIDLDRVRRRVEASFGPGALRPRRPGCFDTRHVPFTGRAKHALANALREARSLGHDSLRPGHVLLGLLGDQKGVAAEILREHGVSAAGVREALAEGRRKAS